MLWRHGPGEVIVEWHDAYPLAEMLRLAQRSWNWPREALERKNEAGRSTSTPACNDSI